MRSFIYFYRLRISKIPSKLFGAPQRAVRQKISASETHLPTSPSEQPVVHIDTERDEHEESTNTSCDSHVNTEPECSVDSDDEPWDFVVSYGGSTNAGSVEDLPIITTTQTISPATTPSQLERSQSLNSRDFLFDDSCEEEFPDEFFVFPSDCGNFAMILGPDDWEKFETENSSEENLTSDDDGTSSTGRELGQRYDMACDVDSGASSHSCCHSPVPTEMVSNLSWGSDTDLVAVVARTSDCDQQSSERLEDCDSISENNDNHSDVNQGLCKHNHIIPQLENLGTTEQQTNYNHHTIRTTNIVTNWYKTVSSFLSQFSLMYGCQQLPK